MEKTEKIICLNCNQTFDAPIRETRRGNGKFCSRKCFHEHRVKNIIPKPPNCNCAWCKKEFYLNQSKQKKSKSGLFFCCRAHKDSAQKLGGIKEIMPSHYGTAINCDSKAYRRIAFDFYDNVCANCGYSKCPVLEIHHIDGNRTNNHIENLKVLCPTCHEEVHYLEKSGKYGTYTRKTKIIWPPILELIDMIENTSCIEVSRQLGVSDTSIRKHIKNHT